MRCKISKKLIACYILIVGCILIIFHVFGERQLMKTIVADKKSELYTEASHISSDLIQPYYNNEITIMLLYSRLKATDNLNNTHVCLINKNGVLISDSRTSFPVKYINLLQNNPELLTNTFTENTTLNGYIEEPSLITVFPVIKNLDTSGYVILFYPWGNLQKQASSYIASLNICIYLIAILLLFIFILLHRITLCPLNKLIAATKEYSNGNYSYPISINTHDEYQNLSEALLYMAGDLSKLDVYRKNFIANISHDFRSPLTSIKGYAEAILDGTIPAESQDKYLKIILFETDRLTKLTANLLELNNFENNGVLLDVTVFDVNHTIKTTAESFEGICKKKKITIQLVFNDSETYVEADVGKIQQVLYNLLDNAVKFSHESSRITISTQEKGEKIFVTVKDFGVGIPKDSVKRVWERFYKIDSSRGKDKKGTGLGLSITKEIINAHGENINLISTEGVGTEFIFTLTKSNAPVKPT